MKIGFIGLGKMGFNMVQRLLSDGHEVVVWNRVPEPIKEVEKTGRHCEMIVSKQSHKT